MNENFDDPEEAFEAFLEHFEIERERKYEKGRENYGDAWHDTDPEYLLRRMEEEFYEMRQAAEHYEDDLDSVQELGDFVNFAIMWMVRLSEER